MTLKKKPAKALTIFNESGAKLSSLGFDCVVTDQVCTRWLFKLREMNYEFSGFDHVYIQAKLTQSILQHGYELYRPSEIHDFYVNIPCCVSEVPSDTKLLTGILNNIIYNALLTLSANDQEQLAKLKIIHRDILQKGEKSLARLISANSPLYSVAILLQICGPFPEGGSVYIRIEKDLSRYEFHLFDYAAYYDARDLFHKLKIKGHSLIVQPKKAWLAELGSIPASLEFPINELIANSSMPICLKEKLDQIGQSLTERYGPPTYFSR